MTMVLLAANSGRVINDSFFSHESSKSPPSLTRKGEIYHGIKSEILQCIVPPHLENHRPVTTAAVLDEAVLVHLIRPRSAITIENYIIEEFVSYILTWFEKTERIDIVWTFTIKPVLNQELGSRGEAEHGDG